MLKRLIHWSVQNRILILIATLVLAGWGWHSVQRTPLDAIPDLSDVQVIILTEYPGQAPQVVEDQVTYPLTTAMLSVPYASVVRGYSFFGISFVYVIFEDGTDMYWARSRVLEYLNFVSGRLPAGVNPTLGPDATGVGWVYAYTLESDRHDLSQLRSIQDWFLRYELTGVDGVAEVRLDLGRSLATVTWNPETTPLSEVARSLDSIGYAPHPFRGVEARDMARREERALLIRIAVAGAIAGNVMLIAFALYGGHFHGISEEFEAFFRWVSLALAAPSVTWCATVFYRGAWGALKARALHMDLPIAIGIVAGFTQGAVNTIRGTGEIYFDSVTALIFFLLVGRFLQRRQQLKAASSTELLFSLAPSTARLVESDGVREVPLEALTPGATVEIRAGDSVPADGVVTEGSSTLDRSLLTGESLPEPVEIGDPVHAGTVNLGARLLIEVRATGEDTRVGRLMRLVEEAALERGWRMNGRATVEIRAGGAVRRGSVYVTSGMAGGVRPGWAVRRRGGEMVGVRRRHRLRRVCRGHRIRADGGLRQARLPLRGILSGRVRGLVAARLRSSRVRATKRPRSVGAALSWSMLERCYLSARWSSLMSVRH